MMASIRVPIFLLDFPAHAFMLMLFLLFCLHVLQTQSCSGHLPASLRHPLTYPSSLLHSLHLTTPPRPFSIVPGQDLELSLTDLELEGMISDASVAGNKWVTKEEYANILKHSSLF